MTDSEVLGAVKELGDSRAEIARILCASPLAPTGRSLSASALGMWFTRGHIPFMWRPAALERLGRLEVAAERVA